VVWSEGKACAEVTVAAQPKSEPKELVVPLDLWDAQNILLTRTQLKLDSAGPNVWKGRLPLDKIQEAKKQHRLVVSLLSEELGVDYYEEIVFSGNLAGPVLGHGVRADGVFPDRKVSFVLNLAALHAPAMRDIPVSLAVRDADDNLLFNRPAAIKPAAEPQQYLLDVTPDAVAVGPFKLEASIDSESQGLSFNASLAFGQPNALVPVSSMEHGDPGMWFAADGLPETYRTYELYPPGAEQLYYSPQLVDLAKHDEPRLSYDRETKHSGRQSLRIDYLPLGEINAWSVQTLPGKPLYLSLWVKGNESHDQLVVRFEDSIVYTGPAWERWANFSTALVGTLDFSGWRRFRVPVLGYGQQVSGTKGSTPRIDAPIRLLAFSIKPPRPSKNAPPEPRRTIWIDDLAVETQVPPAAMLNMELQPSDAAGRLTVDGSLNVTIGSGYREAIKRGSLSLAARDAGGNAVWTSAVPLPVPAEGFAAAEVPLAELAAKKPRGPVELEVTFQDLARPGVRITRPLPFKAAAQAGIVQDFEEANVFSGYRPGKVLASQSRIVEGGANGSKHALALPMVPGEESGSVLFHPALPGVVDSVEMMIHGDGTPATLQPWFIDSGYTGVWQRPYNLFWADPIQVDWQGWRKVSIAAPPIPPYYGDKARYFYRQPWYPLNLALGAKPNDEAIAAEIRIDDIRVITHLPEEEQLHAEIDFPDEHRIHAPGAPLQLVLTNFAAAARPLALEFTLTDSQSTVAQRGKVELSIAAGAKQRVTLLEHLPPGIYDLQVRGLGAKPLGGCVMALDAKAYFGDNPNDLLVNPHLLRRLLGLTAERLYLDWDNTEPAPNLIHAHWFEEEVKRHRNIQILPEDLQAPAAKQTAALAAVKQCQQDLKQAQSQATNAVNAEKPAADRLSAMEKAALAAKADADAARKNLDALVSKPEVPAGAAGAAKARQAKAGQVRAEQQLRSADDKFKRAEAARQAAQTNLDERLKASADALAAMERMERELQAAQAAVAAASEAFDRVRSKYDFNLLPVVGFCADWAGPEAADAVARGTFMRWIPNILQVPRRMIDWSQFVRNIQREYRGRFDHWVFWENPDLDDAPQGVPPAKYAEMLDVFARWVKLYNPQAKVVAGGLNFSKSLGYLGRIPQPQRLPFDEIHVQMNLGELSPEQADVEGYLDDLNALLKLPETGRTARITELDWGIGPLLSPIAQAAYHARAALILDSRGVAAHQFSLLNTGFEFDGYGVFYRVAYGNMPDLQTFKPVNVPKPSCFALLATRQFLRDWKYVTSVELSDRSLADNRAYVYRNAAGELTVAVWRTVDGPRSYCLPESWQGARARDVFGFPVTLDHGLPCLPLPILVQLPAGASLERLLEDLRMLRPTDGTHGVLVDLHLAEADSCLRAHYQATGKIEQTVHAGQIAGDRKIRETFLHSLETEQFDFTLDRPGNVLLRRRWFFEGEGQNLALRLNEGPEQAWDLSRGQGSEPGVRETTFVLRGREGANHLAIRYQRPGNCAGYRLEPLEGDTVSLVRWGVLNTRQTRGQMTLHASAVGTPLAFGRTSCGDGIGAHATSFIEYPLDGQFRALDVSVGIDGSTEGRGSVVFHIYVDGKERANSGVMTGFSKPKTLNVGELENARRLILNVTDADDGNRDDLANWVDGRLYLAPGKK
jgi:hypothetical protein